MARPPLVLALLFVLPIFASTAERPAPYAWPPVPSADEIHRAMSMSTDSGLIILTRTCTIEVQSYGGRRDGYIKRDEFIRFLVVNEEGTRRATLTISGDERARIDRVEGRTVSAAGQTMAVDSEKDIKRVDVRKFRSKDARVSLASVAFPAPEKGALLDLHSVTTDEYTSSAPISFVQGMTYEETPSLNADFFITLIGGIAGKGWSVLTLGDSQGASHLEMEGKGQIRVHVGPFTPLKAEPYDPPDLHNRPFILGYIDLSGIEIEGRKKNTAYRKTQSIDPRGRVVDPAPEPGPARDWWIEYLKNDAKQNKAWTSRPGRA
jgi:hypothetical protein